MTGVVSVKNSVDTGHEDMIVRAINYQTINYALHSMTPKWIIMGGDWLRARPTELSKYLMSLASRLSY